MKASAPIQRASWSVEIGQLLFVQEDDIEFSHRKVQDPNLKPEDICFRVDWQTLRRLPLSGAVLFNFKALFTPVPELRHEPYVPALLLKVLTDAKEAILKYKGTWHVEHIVKPALAEYVKYQEEEGMVERNWEPRTLADAPFYPGWEERWMRNGGVATVSPS